MELNIPAIHGVGASRIYFVDRYDKFSIYDVDFVPLPGLSAADQRQLRAGAQRTPRHMLNRKKERTMPNLGLGLDSFHLFATNTALAALVGRLHALGYRGD